MTPTEADMARRAGFGNWVDRVAELEDENIRLRLLQQPGFCNVCLAHAPNKAGQCLSCMTEAELQTAADQLTLVHSRLDAMGVPACETETCGLCKGLGSVPAGNVLGWEPCECNGWGQRPVSCRISARLDWVAEQLKKPTLTLRDVGEIPPLPYPLEAKP